MLAGGGRVPETGAERGAREDTVREIRALGRDGREDCHVEQPAHRGNGDRSEHRRRPGEHRICEQFKSALRVTRLATD